MRALLDTHALLWWITDDPRLSPRARAFMADGTNALLWSSASSWEVALKHALGNLALPAPPAAYLPHHLRANDITSLPVSDAHAFGVADLPPHHRDPFDRLLVAVARAERVPLITGDPMLARYEVERIW